jgi:hypothetical protein
MSALDEGPQCQVCGDESESEFVGVAAVPGAPLSVGWCKNCLDNHAIPRFVAEHWLLAEFDDPETELWMPPTPPEKFPLADWAGEQTVWMGVERGYVKLQDCYTDLWRDEYESRQS